MLMKAHQERLAARRVVDGALELQQLEESRAQVNQRLDVCSQARSQHAQDAAVAQAACERERARLAQLDARARQARAQLDAARAAHQMARQEVKTVERLVDRAQLARTIQENRAEQRSLDDLYLMTLAGSGAARFH